LLLQGSERAVDMHALCCKVDGTGCDALLTAACCLHNYFVLSAPDCIRQATLISTVRTQGMGCLAVLLLARLPELAQLRGLQDCPALRAVSVCSCGNLQKLDTRGLARLEQLRIRDCERMQDVVGVAELCVLTCLVVAGCAQLQELELVGEEALLTVRPNLDSLKAQQREAAVTTSWGTSHQPSSEIALVRPTGGWASHVNTWNRRAS
jgi:hypothetical protein